MNICEPDGAARWVDAGRPIVPCLLVGRVASPILHVAQLATMLGLEAPAHLAVTRLAWDGAAVLDAWLKLIRPLDQKSSPRRRHRAAAPCATCLNVFHPFELLPTAFETGRFDWDPTLDEDREAAVQNAAAVVAYASDRHLAWQDWLRENESDLLARDPDITSPRGHVTYANLLDSQRWHAAFHYRQLLAFLDGRGYHLQTRARWRASTV